MNVQDSVPTCPDIRAELVAIVTRAHRLGFCCWRVATALHASQRELALIEEQIGAGDEHDRQQPRGLAAVDRQRYAAAPQSREW